LEVGQGVRIMIESDGLRAYWPRWGHDTDGVRW
jgi:hypothetical protein